MLTPPPDGFREGVEITGEAESREKGDYLYVRIKPVGKTSWGL